MEDTINYIIQVNASICSENYSDWENYFCIFLTIRFVGRQMMHQCSINKTFRLKAFITKVFT